MKYIVKLACKSYVELQRVSSLAQASSVVTTWQEHNMLEACDLAAGHGDITDLAGTLLYQVGFTGLVWELDDEGDFAKLAWEPFNPD